MPGIRVRVECHLDCDRDHDADTDETRYNSSLLLPWSSFGSGSSGLELETFYAEELSFLDDDLDRQYRAEERWGRIVGYGSFFAILVACLGLFGLAALTVAGRTKEIGIRKVLGASITGVTTLISKRFAGLVLIGVVLAAPAAYLVMNRWLQNFAYRIEIGWSVFFLAGGLALVIALLTVSAQALRAALANPVDALQYE
jgi:putative ABC transport system permease protein